MNREEIIAKLRANYSSFGEFILSLNETEFSTSPTGKWNAGQQLDHLIRAVSPLSTGLHVPKFVVKMLFGKANRPSRSYEELVKKYQSKLAAGGKAGGQFIPKKMKFYNKKRSLAKLSRKINQLAKHTENYSEHQLDTFILPHPLLGKVTMREMMYFTIYHAEHHHQQAIRNAGK